MGHGFSSEANKLKRQEKKTEKQKQARHDSIAKHVKLLLLGPGESGKSTVLKQMRLIHSQHYEKEERLSYRAIIYSNMLQNMKVLVYMTEKFGLPLSDNDSVVSFRKLQNPTLKIEPEVFPYEILKALEILWANPSIQVTFERRYEYQLHDSAAYFFQQLSRLCTQDYLPSDEDILRARVKTTGTIEMTFQANDLTYHLCDVGGQRSERKKWIHAFENVTAIIFVVSLSAYDQVLLEDEAVNRMDETLALFSSICNSRWFSNTSMVLFLNKMDLFEEKVKVSPVCKYFPDYVGPEKNADAAVEFFKNKFLALNRQPQSKQIYIHVTTATDTENIRFVMAAVNDIIYKDHLRSSGLL